MSSSHLKGLKICHPDVRLSAKGDMGEERIRQPTGERHGGTTGTTSIPKIWLKEAGIFSLYARIRCQLPSLGAEKV